MTAALIAHLDEYLAERTGCYDYRAVRYSAAGDALVAAGIDHSHTVYDIGAGFTELDYHLRTALDWRGRYVPVDGAIDGVDLDAWMPPREAEHAVALELLEHLHDPGRLVRALQRRVTRSIVVSVPNPRTVDVLGIDRTHVTVVTRDMLRGWGFHVEERFFYGGVFSSGEPDSLFGVWAPA